jgi:hypothetical protein
MRLAVGASLFQTASVIFFRVARVRVMKKGGSMKKFAIFIAFFFMAIHIGRPMMAAGFEMKAGSVSLDTTGDPRNSPTTNLRDKSREEKSFQIDKLITNYGKHRLSFSYQGGDSEERSFPEPNSSFSSKSFSLNEELAIELDYDIYDLIYQYDLLNLDNFLAGFSLGLIGQVKLLTSQATVLRSAGRQQQEDFRGSFPLVGFNLHMSILDDLLEGRIRATGMGYRQENIFDGRAEFAVSPYPFLDIYGGYRFYLLNIEKDDDKLDYDKSGPYLGITFSF